jgi:SAM-dependent methyltransferase
MSREHIGTGESIQCGNRAVFPPEPVCRISGEKLHSVIDLGNIYISNFLESADFGAPKAPLQIGLCEQSGFLQLMHVVERGPLFEHYWYQSATNATMPRQLKDIVGTVQRWVELTDGDIVLDIGCNDGTLLKAYPPNLSLVKVGIDPAKNIAEKALHICDLHAADFFSTDIYFSLTDGKKAKVITSIAMFYSLDDPHQFVEDVVKSLCDDGIWVVQMSYAPLMIAQNGFDNICHEHTGHYTLQAMNYLISLHDLRIVDVELTEVNGGSFRLVIMKNKKLDYSKFISSRNIGRLRYESIIAYERECGFDRPEVYMRFMERVNRLREQTLEHLLKLKMDGKRIYGYGASTKGNTLLQYFGLGTDLITAIAERQPEKWGLFTVGSWIPIVSEAEMRLASPDYLVMLPWHFVHEFLEREQKLRSQGCRFILPLPELLTL